MGLLRSSGEPAHSGEWWTVSALSLAGYVNALHSGLKVPTSCNMSWCQYIPRSSILYTLVA